MGPASLGFFDSTAFSRQTQGRTAQTPQGRGAAVQPQRQWRARSSPLCTSPKASTTALHLNQGTHGGLAFGKAPFRIRPSPAPTFNRSRQPAGKETSAHAPRLPATSVRLQVLRGLTSGFCLSKRLDCPCTSRATLWTKPSVLRPYPPHGRVTTLPSLSNDTRLQKYKTSDPVLFGVIPKH